jgi:hypothetical protein
MRTRADVGAIEVSSVVPASRDNIDFGVLGRLVGPARPLSKAPSPSFVLTAFLSFLDDDDGAVPIAFGLPSVCDFADDGVYLAAARVAAMFDGDMARLFGELCGTLKLALGGGYGEA